MTDYIQLQLEREAHAIKNIPIENGFEKAIDIIYKAVHTNSKKLVASGMGKAGQIAHNIATTFSSTGTPAVFLHPSEAQHGDMGVVQPGDVLFLVSNSGKTRELVELVELCNRLHGKLSLIVLSGNPKSELALLADASLNTGNPDEICPLGLTPTTSTTTMTVIGDIMVTLMMNKIDFTAEDYAKRHHGGYLGTKSRAVSQKDSN